MNTLSFTHQHRRSTKTLRLNYGLEGMKYIIQVYEGEINGNGEKEGLPTEYHYDPISEDVIQEKLNASTATQLLPEESVKA